MTQLTGPLRGQVFHSDPAGTGPHFWVVVSNNVRNKYLLSVLAVMITSTPPRSPRPSCVPLSKGLDAFEGWVVCDEIGPVRKEVLGRVRGSLSPPTMRLVDRGLAFALNLPRPA